MLCSVVLPTYNGQDWITRSVNSILAQSFTNFELIIIDDGSSDNTFEILKKFKDKRIKLFRQNNRGLAKTLNIGIKISRGKYIFRQDQDDISFPNRFMEQIVVMEKKRDLGFLGTWAEILNESRIVRRFHKHPVDANAINYFLLFSNPFVHSSMILRKNKLTEVNGYSEDLKFQPPEDYHLWSKLARICKGENLPKILVQYQETKSSMSRNGNNPFLNNAIKISAENLIYAANLKKNNIDAFCLASLLFGKNINSDVQINFKNMKKIWFKACLRVSQRNPKIFVHAFFKFKISQWLYLVKSNVLGKTFLLK